MMFCAQPNLVKEVRQSESRFSVLDIVAAYIIDNMTDTTVVVAASRERKFFTSSKGTLTECHFYCRKLAIKSCSRSSWNNSTLDYMRLTGEVPNLGQCLKLGHL